MRYALSDLLDWTTETLIAANVRPDNARSVARALVAAEAAGQGGHGLRRIPSYTLQARTGKADGFATPEVTQTAPAVLRINANLGFAYPALDLAVEKLVPLARQNGIAAASIYRSHHAGVMGLTVERLAEQGLVALMMANAPACMAPWGGKRPMFGTNPLAFAAPVAGSDPVVVDMALSTVARGKIMAARQKGEAIPADWALDVDGNPTTDPERAMAGTMRPLGGAKGSALALMVEMMAAGLTGGHFATEASSLFDEKGGAPSLGHTLIAIDPVATGGADAPARLAELAHGVASDPGARLPGLRGRAARRQAEAEGLEVSDDEIALIRPAQSLA